MKVAVVYSRVFAPWVEQIARDLVAHGAPLGGDIEAIVLEQLLSSYQFRDDIECLYVLPCTAPSGHRVPELLRSRFPRAHVFVPFEVQDLCWNKIATQKRMLDRGIPTPETILSYDPEDVVNFVKQHTYAILKEPEGCAGTGHWVLWFEGSTLMADNGWAAYRLCLGGDGPSRIVGDELHRAPPYYVQRLVGTFQRPGFAIGQVLRAYVIEGEVPFWGERYREHYRRPGDWILNVTRGARYQFVLAVSEETKTTALRAARAVGARVAAVDLVRTSASGPLVLEVNVDSYHMCIDRSFKDLPEFREYYDFDRYLARALLRAEETTGVRTLRPARPRQRERRPRRT
jgi:hypothetical protein